MWENRKNLAKTGLFYYSLVIMNEIYLAKNHLMIKTEYKDPEMHRHSAAHILISLKGPVRFQVDGQEMTGFGAVIPSGLPHTVCGAPDEEGKPFSMPSLLLFLFDETTFVAQCIRESRLITEKQAQTVLQWYRDMREAADAAAAYPSFLRKVLKELGLSDTLVWRQPFPGPGLAIRIMGEITDEKLTILQDADWIFREEIAKAGLDRSICQYFAVLTNNRSVGVMGDFRTYDYTLALRAVTTTDFMTADFARIPYEVLEVCSARIVNEVKNINRVVYDVTTKPPATIEWE